MSESQTTHRKQPRHSGDRPQKGAPRGRRRSLRDIGSEHRDVTNILGGDPDYIYRWVYDESANGRKIFVRQERGYELVDASKEDLKVGEHRVGHDTHHSGSVYQMPADSQGGCLFLMRIHKDWYQEDEDYKMEEIAKKEGDITRERDPETDPDGQYGKNKLGSNLMRVRDASGRN